MANKEHLEILRQGVEVWNKWRKENRDVAPDLREANLSGADLRLAILREADLSGASVGSTTFGFVDLSLCEGVEAARHRGPSIIGIDTIYRSEGKIPEVFLRGAGAPVARRNLGERKERCLTN